MRVFRLPVQVVAFCAACLFTHAKPVTFNLPAKAAHKSLMSFARQVDVEVLFSFADMKRVKAAAVVGTYEPEDALDIMLSDTDFEAEKTATGKFSIRRKTKKTVETSPENAALEAGPSIGNPDTTSESADYVTLSAFVVTPSRFGIAQERMGTEATLTAEQIETLPQLGEDMYRMLTRLPGLASTDTSAKFWVRGAPNSQILSRLDGVDLIEPFHLKDYDGALSIVDPETISSVNLMTGGFTTNYGDRLTGVMEMETQSDPGEEGRNTLGLSVTHMRATTQGEYADGKGEWLLAARRGYIDLALKLGGESDVDDAPEFYDLSGKLSYELNDNHTVSVHMLHSSDEFNTIDDYADPDLHANYDNTYLWGRWLGKFGERVSSEAVVSYSRLDWNRESEGFYDFVHPFSLDDHRNLEVFGIRNDWTVYLTEDVLLRSGIEYKAAQADYDYFMSRSQWTLETGDLQTEVRQINANLSPERDKTSAYIAPRMQIWNKFVVEPGIRFDRHSNTGESSWSPRLNASFVNGRTAVRAAWGEYRQAHGIHELSVADGETRFQKSELAEQRVIGISQNLDNGIGLRVEVYDRNISNPRTHWENAVNFLDAIPEAQYDRFEVNPSRAKSSGVEFFVENRDGGIFDWGLSYAHGKSEEQVAGKWVPRVRDQEHTFTADFTWIPNRKWQFGFSFEHHTGWPYTDVMFSEYELNNGEVINTWAFGSMNALRAPDYQRLDLRASRIIQLKDSTLRVFIDIFNTLDHDNVYGFEDPLEIYEDGSLIAARKSNGQLPMLPSFGISWEF